MYPVPDIQVRTATTSRKDANETGREYQAPRLFRTFTKWVELIPLRKATTATLIRAFRERIISHFGAPRKLVCDNGSQFSSKTFKDFLKETGVEPQFTAPYCPRENPTNRTVKAMTAQTLATGGKYPNLPSCPRLV